MALNGERLRQLLRANAKRRQKRRENHLTCLTTGEERDGDCEDYDDDIDEDDKENAKENYWLENGISDEQYINCYVVASKGRLCKERWIKPYGSEPLKTDPEKVSFTVESNTYTACVTEDMAFKRIREKDIPPCIRRPRSTSMNIYIVDSELTECIKQNYWRNYSTRMAKLSETPVSRRKYSDLDDAYSSIASTDGSDPVPPVPPKLETLPQFNIPPQPPSLKFRKSRTTKDSDPGVDKGVPTSQESAVKTSAGTQAPPLPLPPRKNRPQLTSIARKDVQSNKDQPELSTPKSRRTNANTERTGRKEKSSKENEIDENHYEAVELQKFETNTTNATTDEIKATQTANANGDTFTSTEVHENDSVFEGNLNSNQPTCNGPDSGQTSTLCQPEMDSNLARNSDSTLTPVAESAPTLPQLDAPNKQWDSTSEPVKSEVELPKLTKLDVAMDGGGSDSSDTDKYEDIDVGNRRQVTVGSLKYHAITKDKLSEDSGYLLIHRDDIVIVEREDACCTVPHQSNSKTFHHEELVCLSSDTSASPSDKQPDDLKGFLYTSLTYDKDGNAIYIPTNRLKVYGDPAGEPWFYPLELSSIEATLFLRGEEQEGCFLIYKPSNSSSSSAYNLAVSRGNGDVLHYHILERPEGGFMVEGHDHSFLNLADLVEYFRRNKSTLATRLRRPLKEARLPITAGYHYDLAYELNRNRLTLTGTIIGQGNFGIVCSGTYGSIQVAVKVLQGTDLSMEDEDEFIEEARVLMLLRHEHVVRIIGVSSSVRPFFLVTEFIQHGNLKDCLRDGRIPTDKPDILLNICLQMLAALSYLESNRYILHRDIAARNFLVAELKCIKLADFGRARLVTDDNYQAPRTEKISIKWAAPEVLIDFRYSTKSDMWAAGVAMWEVFSVGERPYESLSAEQTALYVTEGGRLPRPSLCPEDTFSIVSKCWRRSAAARPAASSLHQTMLENRNAAMIRRNQKKADTGKKTTITVPTTRSPVSKPPLTPTLRKKLFDNSDKQRFSAIRDVFITSSFKEGSSVKKTISSERLQTSSSSENISLVNTSYREEFTTGDKIRKSFRKFLNKKKTRTPSKSKGDYGLGNENNKHYTVTDV